MSDEQASTPKGRNTRQLLLIVACVILAIAAVVGWGVALSGQQQASNEKQKSQTAIDEANQSIANLQATATSTNQAIIDERVIQSDTQSTLVKVQTQLSTTLTQKSDLNKQVSDLQSQLKAANSNLTDLEAVVDCADALSKPKSIDYSSNATVSASLKAWIEGASGTVNTAKWEVIYTNSKPTIHRLTTDKYLFVFLVYFDEPGSNRKNSVFDVAGSCFADRAK